MTRIQCCQYTVLLIFVFGDTNNTVTALICLELWLNVIIKVMSQYTKFLLHFLKMAES